jgi:MFS family permease
MNKPASSTSRPAMPRTVWALGLVSLLMDTSSEVVHSLLPVFLVGTLGVSATGLGLIEGAAEALALITKVFSGYLSDVMRRRKPLVLLGYGLAALTKPLFPLADSAGTVLAARLLDRVGKGIRGAPRDALMADVVPPAIRGAAFGLRQSLDTVGAFAGPLLAVMAMTLLLLDVRQVLWLAVIPAMLAVVALIVGVDEPERSAPPVAARLPLSRAGLRQLGRGYWAIVAAGALLSLARFSEAFLILRVSDLGLPTPWIPLVLVAMSGVYMLAAYPAGRLADRVPRRSVLVVGVLVLVLADGLIAGFANAWGAGLGIALWGAHLALTQGVFAALIADNVPAALRGTAFGAYNLASGLALLVSSAGAGWLWDWAGPSSTFSAGAALALVAAVAALRLPGRPLPQPQPA